MITTTREEEAAEAKLAMDRAYHAWTLADPLYEQECWLTYQAAVERYNALVAEEAGRTERRTVRMPWWREDGGTA